MFPNRYRSGKPDEKYAGPSESSVPLVYKH